MYISMHIPKTGGNTFKDHLKVFFGDDICFRNMTQWTFVDVYTPTLSMRAHRAFRGFKVRLAGRNQLYATDRCIHGHFRADTYLDLFPESRCLTWLREPVERLISQYNYWKRKPFRGHSVCKMLIERKLSLLEFGEIEVMRNLQSRYFHTLGIADFWFVGITEHFQSCVRHLYDLMEMEMKPAEIAAQNTNPTKNPKSAYEVDASTRAKLVALNSRDYKLYELAVERAIKLEIFSDLNSVGTKQCTGAQTAGKFAGARADSWADSTIRIGNDVVTRR